MAKKSTQTKFVEQIEIAVADHVAEREDRHGFSRLDVLLGELERKEAEDQSHVEDALLTLLPIYKKGTHRTWEAIRMIIDAANLRSTGVATCIMKILDEFKDPTEPAARFEALLAYKAAGGTITRPRLDKENHLRDEMRPQWVDLALSAYYGAPESIISLLEEQLRDKAAKFTWEDIRRRL